MTEELLVRYCSPTLAGMKTASLFNCEFQSLQALEMQIAYFNHELNPSGVHIELLRTIDQMALIYVYRPKMLLDTFLKDDVQQFLMEHGYFEYTVKECIARLKKRLAQGGNFPHEIGMFLGYPLEDVKAFIKYKGANCKCIGCWKVYSNEYEAEKIFAKYKRCTDIYCRLYGQGRTVRRLTVVA